MNGNKSKVLIEFSWRGQTISQYISLNALYNDIVSDDDFYGTFSLYGNVYQYQIYWASQELAIFDVGGNKPIDYVHRFELHFSRIFK